MSSVLNLSRRIREIFESSGIDEKRQILNFVLQNPTVRGKKLEFTTRKTFDMVLELSNTNSLLAFLKQFRTMDWTKVYKYPSVTLDQMKTLLAECETATD